MITNGVVSGGPQLPIPSHLSYGEFVINKLREICGKGNKTALINGDTNEHVSYKEMLQKIVSIGCGLRNIGLKKGEVVALCSENCFEFLAATVAASCVGATVTAYNMKYTKDELAHTVNISKPRFIFGSETAFKTLLKTFQDIAYIKRLIQINGTAVSPDVLMLEELETEGDVQSFECEEVDTVKDTAFIYYSSGTTGLPKGVALSHRGVLHGSAIFNYANESNSRLLTVTRWYHVYGLMTSIWYISTDNLVIYLPEFKPETYLQAIEKFKITEIIAVPTIVVMLAKSPLASKYDLSSLKLVWCAAAPLGAETITQALKNLPGVRNIYQAYGMTETSLAVVKEPQSKIGKSGSCGIPLPGTEAKVVDIRTRKKLGPNKQGEICLKGPTMMIGYVDNEKATRDIIDEEGFIKSGDIGHYDEDGWLYVVDRIKELIKYKGQQVAPAAIETILLEHNGVAECGVVGAPDELAGELPTAFVVPKPGFCLTEADLLDFTGAKLSPAARLRGGVVFIQELPRNGSGKILRRELRKMLHTKSYDKMLNTL